MMFFPNLLKDGKSNILSFLIKRILSLNENRGVKKNIVFEIQFADLDYVSLHYKTLVFVCNDKLLISVIISH